MPTFAGNSIFKRTQTGSFTGTAVIAARHFTGDAVIVGFRNRHDRAHDHDGTQDDTTVVLSADIGPYPEGTTVHDFLVGLSNRILELENNVRYWGSFTGNAVIAPHFTGDAVLKNTLSASFTGDAVFGRSFTGNAYIVSPRSFTGDAFFV